MALRDRFVDPNSPDRRPRKAAYVLPTLFTADNIFLGYVSILRSFQGAMLAATGSASAPDHFAVAFPTGRRVHPSRARGRWRALGVPAETRHSL